MIGKRYLVTSLFTTFSTFVFAQAEVSEADVPQLDYDTAYIKSYRDELNVRFYTSYKYTSFTLPAISGANKMFNGLAFRPNATLNNGFGLTHKGFTLNLGTGFPGINGDGSERGKTRILDFQMHMYLKKFVLDLYFQRYQGFYHNDNIVPGAEGFYSDPNTKLRQFGLGYTYVANHKRFTFRPSNLHDAIQLKSTGSLLYGFEFIYAQIKNDENPILASALGNDYPYFADVTRLNTYNFGPSLGYAYNWLFAPKFFLMASASVSLHGSIYQDRTNINQLTRPSFSLTPAGVGRFAVGYNSEKWAFSVYVVHGVSTTNIERDRYNLSSMHTGNLRASIVRRFTPGPKAKRILRPWYFIFK